MSNNVATAHWRTMYSTHTMCGIPLNSKPPNKPPNGDDYTSIRDKALSDYEFLQCEACYSDAYKSMDEAAFGGLGFTMTSREIALFSDNGIGDAVRAYRIAEADRLYAERVAQDASEEETEEIRHGK